MSKYLLPRIPFPYVLIQPNDSSSIYDSTLGYSVKNKLNNTYGYLNIDTNVFTAGSFTGGDEIKQREYLEATGTQYIDTGYKANTTKTIFKGAFTPKSVQPSCGLLGSRNNYSSAGDASCNIFVLDSSKFRLDWYNATGSTMTDFGDITLNTKYNIEITRGRCTINGQTITNGLTSSVDQNYNFYIGNFNNAGSKYTYGFIGYIWPCTLYEDDTIVHSYVPITVGNIGAMYDLVSNKIYYNVGTGSFTYGEVVPMLEVKQFVNEKALKGKNLFDPITMGTNEHVWISNNVLKQTSDNSGVIIPITEGKTYTISHNISDMSIFRVCTYTRLLTDAEKESGVTVSNAQAKSTGVTSITLTAGADDKYMYIQVNGNKFTTFISVCQVEEGSTPTPYEPYGDKINTYLAVKAIKNKNLCSSLSAIGDFINGSFTPVLGARSKWCNAVPIEVKPNTTYYFTVFNKPSWATFSKYNFYTYGIDKQKIRIDISTGCPIIGTFTTQDNEYYLNLSTFGDLIDSQEKLDEYAACVMIVEGDTAPTEYEPYGYTIHHYLSTKEV